MCPPSSPNQVTKKLGGSDKFHTASLQEVFDAYQLDGGGFMDLPRIVEDGVVLPKTPLRGLFDSKDTFNEVPIISGVWRIRAVDRPLAMMTAAGHEDVYAYRFDWDEGGKILWMDLSKILGAAHSVEIPFVMNRFKLLGEADPVMFKDKTLATRQSLSRSMGSYWANFARTGQPNGEGLPDWPRYGQQASVIYLDSTNDGGIRTEAGADNFTKIITELKADTRIDAAEKCEIAQSMIDWVPTLQADLDALIECSFAD